MSSDPPINFLQRFAMPPLIVSTVLIGFSVPISTALDNLLLSIVLLGVTFNARSVWQIARENPVARASWLLFGVLLVGVFYGATPWREAVNILGKYVDLAFVPLFMLVLSSESARRWGQYSFLAAMALTLFLSYMVGFELLSVQPWMNEYAIPSNPAIFHRHITHNNLMAFATFLALLNLREATSRAKQLAWGMFAMLAANNALLMVQGRTGYLVLLALLGLFTWSTMQRNTKMAGKVGWRQGGAVVLFFFVVLAGAYYASPQFHNRLHSVASEMQTWRPGISYEHFDKPKPIAITRRLDFYYNTLHIVQQQPVLGVGTGGLPAAYMQQTQGQAQTTNPHNEYLMIAVQTGLVGLALLLYLFYTQKRCARLLGTPFAQDAAAGLVLAYMIDCMFNSPLLDHGPGLFFAFMTAVFFGNLKMGKHG